MMDRFTLGNVAAADARKRSTSRTRRLKFEPLETRRLLSVDPLSTPGQTPGDDWPIGVYAQKQGTWLDFDPTDGPDLGAGFGVAADLQFVESPTGIAGQLSIAGVWLAPVTLGGVEFAGLSIPDSGSTDAVGDPQLPVLRKLLSVPDGATVTAEMTGHSRLVSMVDVGIDLPLAPLQQPVVKLAGQLESAPLDWSQTVYQTDKFTPGETLRVTEVGKIAGQRVVLLEIAPIAYNPVAEAISVYDTLTFQLNFEDVPQPEVAEPAEAVGDRLLIIAHDDFAGQLSSLVNHKTSIGWTVDLIDTTTAGITSTSIRSTIRSRYDNPATRPDALLLVGDTDRIPHFVGSGEGNPPTDLYYSTMDDGDDWFPEFPVGRMSVAGTGQLAAVVAKTIAYETAPAGAWTNRAAFMAGIDNSHITEATHNSVIDAYMDPLGYTSDKLYATSYGATTQDVRNALNEGRALGIYSGHGSEYSWADGPAFSQADVRTLTNSAMYPLVASFACVTGAYTLDESFTETWLRVPGRGAVAVVGSSVNSYWTEDDVLQKKLFEAIYGEGYVGYGNAWMRAKELFLEYFGVNPTTRRYFEMYNMMGDPTVEVVGLEFGIRSPAELSLAHLDEAYRYTLDASSGTAPYAWNLTAGSLPLGLSLNGNTGVIGGTARSPGTVTFTVEVTDAAAATDSREFTLPVATRLQSTTPSELPAGVRGQPYSTTLDALGGLAPYRWSLVGTGQYEQSYPGPGFRGGGTAQSWQGDDVSWNLALPWDFEFYGTAYDSVNVSSNGFLDFVSTSSEYSNSRGELLSNVRIAPFWDDLYIDVDGDILVTETDDYVAVRWDGETYDTEGPVDFEAVLYRDGRIAFSYYQVPQGVSPTIGLSGGDGTHYVFSSYNERTWIPSRTSAMFAYATLLPDGVTFDEATGRISGTPSGYGVFELTCRVEDDGTPLQSDVRTFTMTVTEMPPLVVELPESATEGGGLMAGQGTVRIPDVLAVPLVVTLASQDPSEVTLPAATVVIPAGLTSATFDLIVREDSVLDGTQVATIVASAADHSNGTGGIAVHDNETATITVTVPATTAAENAGYLAGWGLVRLSATPTADIVVTLISDDETELTLSPTVIIPAGQRFASFDLTVIDDTEIDFSQHVTITARVENWTAVSDTIEITDDDHRLEIALPATVWESQATLIDAGTVSIGGTLSHDLVVSLASDRLGELAIPASVTIPAGQLSARFDVTVTDNQDSDGSRPVQITAVADGFSDVVVGITLGDDELHHFAVTEVASPQTANVPFSLTLAAKDVNGATIEIFDAPVELTAADGAATPLDVVLLPLDAGISFVGGQWTGNVQIDALAAGVVFTVDDHRGHTSESNAFSLTAGPVDRFQFSEIASPQHPSHPIDVTLTALDANGYVATSFDRQAVVSGTIGADEVTIGSGTHAWEYPMATYYHDARTQVIYLSSELGPATTITALALNVTQAPGQTLEGWTIRVKHTPLDSYGDTLWETTGWTTTVRRNQRVTTTGWVNFQFSTPFVYNGVDNLMIDFSFNNDDYTSDGYCLATDTASGAADGIDEFRSISYESDSYDGNPLIWSDSGSTLPYRDTLVPNIRLTLGENVSISPTVTAAFSGGRWSGQVTVNEAVEGMQLWIDGGQNHVGASEPFDVDSIPSLTLEMAGSFTEGDGTMRGSVTIPYSRVGNLAVALSSGDASEVVVPSPVVVIPAGTTSAQFDLQIQDDAVLDGTQGVAIEASAQGYYGGTATLAVHDNETATLSVTLPAAAAEGDGLLAGQGTVTLSAAPQSDVDVQLISSDDTEVSVPVTTTVPAGQTSAQFDLSVVDDGEIDALQTAAITARVENWTAGTDSIEISDNEERTLAVSFSEDFWEGDGVVGGGGSVSIPGTLTEPLEVSLASNDTREMAVPHFVTIPAGSTLARFDVTVMNDVIEDGAQTVTVTGRAEGFTPGIATVDVGDNEVHHFAFQYIESPQEIGEPFEVTIYAREINDLTIGSYTGKVSLTGLGDGGAVVVVTTGGAGPAMTDAMVDGVWTGDVTISTGDTNVVLTADDGLQHTGTSRSIDVSWLPAFVSTDVPRWIPSVGTVRSTLTVPDTFIIGDVNVHLLISHSQSEDLDVYLIGPDGRRVELFTDVEGEIVGFIDITLDDEGTFWFDSWFPFPLMGSFRPEGWLGAFDGRDARGTWTLEVADDEGWQNGTLLDWSLSFTARTPRIAGRHLFYDGSALDGAQAGPSGDDDLAIATDKVALRGARAATFDNYSSYSDGITGIMVDVADAPAGVTPSAADFLFHVGNDDTPGDWTPLAVQPTVAVRPGDGSGGSDRVTFTWPPGTIRNTWLQVTVKAQNLGLSADDVFYFGNAVAESGDSHADAKVNAADLLLARNNPRGLGNPAGVDFCYDYNRDAAVDATDVLLARNNRTSFLDALKLIDLSGGAEEAQAAPADLAWLWELQRQDEEADGSLLPASAAAVDKYLDGITG